MTVTNLSKTSVNKVIDCFLKAFEGYYVKMPTDHNYYVNRWKAAGVNFDLSYGMFDGDELVAFIIHAVDQRAGKLTAFNTGTGVVPKHRGKRMVKTMYDYALEDLRQKGIERSTLEVITENEKAVRAYQSVGFTICKHYQCFAGEIQLETKKPFELKQKPLSAINWDNLPNQDHYSWDFQPATIRAGNNTFHEVWYNEKPESYFILNPEKTRLLQFDLLSENKHGWNRLFSAVREISENVSTINVDDRLTDKTAALHSVGLAVTVEQFEMELKIR